MLKIEPQDEVTVYDRLTWAYAYINRAIEMTDGGNNVPLPLWSTMNDCRRNILDAMQTISQNNKRDSK